jgi:hypothetical protein
MAPAVPGLLSAGIGQTQLTPKTQTTVSQWLDYGFAERCIIAIEMVYYMVEVGCIERL